MLFKPGMVDGKRRPTETPNRFDLAIPCLARFYILWPFLSFGFVFDFLAGRDGNLYANPDSFRFLRNGTGCDILVFRTELEPPLIFPCIYVPQLIGPVALPLDPD